MLTREDVPLSQNRKMRRTRPSQRALHRLSHPFSSTTADDRSLRCNSYERYEAQGYSRAQHVVLRESRKVYFHVWLAYHLACDFSEIRAPPSLFHDQVRLVFRRHHRQGLSSPRLDFKLGRRHPAKCQTVRAIVIYVRATYTVLVTNPTKVTGSQWTVMREKCCCPVLHS